MSTSKIHQKVINSLNRQKTIEKAIDYLRSLNFFFYEVSTVGIDFKPGHIKYSWMVRRVGKKKDLSMVVGIKMWGKKTEKIIVLVDGDHVATVRIPWADKADINFRKITIRLKFPDYLTYEERRTWRTEYHKQLNNPNRIPSEGYKKIYPDVQHI